MNCCYYILNNNGNINKNINRNRGEIITSATALTLTITILVVVIVGVILLICLLLLHVLFSMKTWTKVMNILVAKSLQRLKSAEKRQITKIYIHKNSANNFFHYEKVFSKKRKKKK